MLLCVSFWFISVQCFRSYLYDHRWLILTFNHQPSQCHHCHWSCWWLLSISFIKIPPFISGRNTSKHWWKLCILKLSSINCKCNVPVMSMWSLRWHFTNRSVTGAPYSIKVTVCHTAGHYGEEYDDWNSDVFRSQRNCSSDGAERTDSRKAFHAWAAATGKEKLYWVHGH